MMRKRNFWFTFVIAVALGSMMLFALQQDGSQLEIVWSKQWGTAAETGSVDNIALDGQGNIYIVGVTEGNLFGQNQGKWDIFVIKLDSNGKVLWSTQLGSAGKEEGVSGAVDGDGNIYLLTLTEGDWFGKNLGSRDIVLLKLSSSGEILWGKRIGTVEDEFLGAIAVDESNHVYITGETRGSLFGKYRGEKWGEYEGFLAKFDFNGNLIWGKQFTEGEFLEAIAVDGQSNIYVAGTTVDEATNEVVTFLAKFNPDGNLVWRRLFPPTAEEITLLTSIKVDGSGNIYGAGYVAVYVDEQGLVYIPDAFVGKYSGDNGQEIWSKRFKSQEEGEIGKIEEKFRDVAVDGQGYVYVVGFAEGSLFGNHLGAWDIILAKFDGQGNMLWGRQWGSAKGEAGIAIAVDGQGNIYVAGGREWSIFIDKFKQ